MDNWSWKCFKMPIFLFDPAVIPEPPVATANPKKIIAPKTGNTGEASGFMAMLLGGIAVIFSGRKKKKVEQTKY